jgi:hypothetical protein
MRPERIGGEPLTGSNEGVVGRRWRWHHASMEYGQVVGQSTGIVGGGGSGDITAQVMNALENVVDQVAALPPPVLIAIAAVVVIGLVFFKR